MSVEIKQLKESGVIFYPVVAAEGVIFEDGDNLEEKITGGVVSSITMNGNSYTPTSGVINLGTISVDTSSKEDKSNKVTSVSASSTDTQYPSAKLFYDTIGDVESVLDRIINPIPKLTALPNTLTITGEYGATNATGQFTVYGDYLTGTTVTLTKADASSAFTLSSASITKANALAGTTITVTLANSTLSEGTYTGTITIASTGADSITVSLSGVVTEPPAA